MGDSRDLIWDGFWWHHWCIKAMPSRVQSQKWQIPGQEHFLLRLKATNHLLFQDIPVEHIVNAKIRELNNKHGYYWFIALLLTFTLCLLSKSESGPFNCFPAERTGSSIEGPGEIPRQRNLPPRPVCVQGHSPKNKEQKGVAASNFPQSTVRWLWRKCLSIYLR